jgi:hypothetical protein
VNPPHESVPALAQPLLQVKRSAILALLVGAVLLVSFGCGVSSTKSRDLVGVYTAKYGHGSEKLTLSADGTFSQVYTQLEDGRSTTNSGKWEWWKKDGGILLRDVYLFDDSGQRRQPLEKSVWRIRIAKRFGKISLIIGEEGVLEYDKAQ